MELLQRVDFMNLYEKKAAKLEKLRRNETQMDQAQFVRYASVLKKYRREIIAVANKLLKHLWLNGVILEKGGQSDEICGKIQGIVNDEAAKGEMKRLKDILFQTYSLDEFLKAACMVQNRILYEAYAPYWISRCTLKSLPDGIQWAGFQDSGPVWYNSLIDMYWRDEYGLWVSGNETAWSMSLPPTRELCESEYEKERMQMGNA